MLHIHKKDAALIDLYSNLVLCERTLAFKTANCYLQDTEDSENILTCFA